jgi:antitoxin YefM
MPRALSYSQLRVELKAVLDEVCDTHDPVYVVRRRGGNVVIVSREDYERMVETAHLLSSPANRQRLKEAVNADPSDFVPVSIDELRRTVED